MKKDAGFSLVEVMVTMVLLAIIAISFSGLVYQRNGFYQNNVAGHVADEVLEDARNIPYNDPALAVNTITPGSQTIMVRGTNTTFNWQRQIQGFNFVNPNIGLSYNLAVGSLLANTPSNTPDIKLVTIVIRVNGVLIPSATRSQYISRPN